MSCSDPIRVPLGGAASGARSPGRLRHQNPAWYDALVLTVRLVEAGHSPAHVLGWLAGTAPGKRLDMPALDAVLTEAAEDVDLARAR
jgi:hypothetical protein